MQSVEIALSELKPNSKNPRFIKDSRFKKLVKSIKDFPQMSKIRPIVVNRDMVILGGNMRFQAMLEAGWQRAIVTVVDDLTKEQEDEFVIKDNLGFGDWDMDVLANEWDEELLKDWGFDDDLFSPEQPDLPEPPEPESEIVQMVFNVSRETEEIILQALADCKERGEAYMGDIGEDPNALALVGICKKYSSI